MAAISSSMAAAKAAATLSVSYQHVAAAARWRQRKQRNVISNYSQRNGVAWHGGIAWRMAYQLANSGGHSVSKRNIEEARRNGSEHQ